MFFFTLILFALTFVLSEVLKPKPKNENARKAGLGDFQFPTATEARVQPLIWGTVKVQGPNVIWYGDLRQKAVKKEVKTGLFSSDDVTTGYRYNIGIQFGLCRGPADQLRRIWIGDKIIYGANSGTEPPITTNADFVINLPKLFGGTELGQGGVSGTLRWYSGTSSQGVDSYLAQFQQQGGDTPAYRGMSYLVAQQFYVGTSTNIEPWNFEIRRIPTVLSGNNAVNGGADANPAGVALEILTNTEWGLGFSTSDIDTAAFNAAGATLAGEGNGFSLYLDNPMEVGELLRELERQMNAVVYLNRTTGKWTIKLCRKDYNVDTVPQLTASTIIETKDFARGAWEDTVNEVRIPFVDRSRDYFSTFSMAQDMANMMIQQSVVSTQVTYPGLSDQTLATFLSWRDLRTLSYPLAKVTITADRTFASINPGDVVAWTDTRLGFTKTPMRVSRVDLGELDNGRVVMALVQEVYSNLPPSYGPLPPTGWTSPSDVLVNIPTAQRIIMESPKAFVDRAAEAPGQQPRVWMGIRNQADGAVRYFIRVGTSDSGIGNQFMNAGKLSGSIVRQQTHTTLDLIADLDTVSELFTLFRENITATEVGTNLFHLLYIGDTTTGEFIACQSVSIVGGTTLRLANVWRGLMDTAPKEWAANTRVWVLQGAITTSAQTGSSVAVKPITESGTALMLDATATSTSVNFSSRYHRPYLPANLLLNGALWPTSTVNLAGTVSGGDGEGILVSFDRRDYRTVNEVSAVVSETIPGDFPAANATKYRVEVRNDPAGANTLLFTTAYNAGTGSITLNRELILRNTAGVVPSRLRVSVRAQHVVGGTTYDSREDLVHDFNTQDTQLASSFNMGAPSHGTYGTAYVAPVAGNYAVTIEQNLLVGGKIVVSINGAADVDVIPGGATSGAVLGLLGTESLRFRVVGQSGSGQQTLLKVDAPPGGGTTEAHQVVICG